MKPPPIPPPLPLPVRVERRMVNQAHALDREFQRIIKRVRYDANAEGRSFIGELFLIQEAMYRIGREVGMQAGRRILRKG